MPSREVRPIFPCLAGLPLLLTLLFWPIKALAHLPDGNLAFQKILQGSLLIKLAIFPEEPQPGEMGEIIVYIEDLEKKEPLKEKVMITVYASGEKGQARRYRANRFGKGFYEVQHVWPKPGEYQIELQVFDGVNEQKIHTKVQIGGGKGPNIIFLGLIGIVLIVAITVVAFLRKGGLEICNKETSD